MNSINTWIEHLHHPLVFAGFGLFIFALLLRPLFLNNSKLTGTATERLLHRGMILVFILASLAIIGGIALNWKAVGQSTASAKKTQPVAQQNSGNKTVSATVEQATQGTQSPAINSGKDVLINYGPASSESQQTTDPPKAPPEKTQAKPVQVSDNSG
ncbi:hypothetical protein VT98_13163 [Candidatus Electrothrix communis]|uniref:Uncharacterized protein n=1 Tax=Candidatus Electrothrix communis TaxID=1859133 RepID=A0A3S3QYE4_9BACT|nr:hypothetical protein VT98_13163 [Candidatus Electrothrix communis]